MKKLLAIFLFALLLCTLIPFAATSVLAAEDEQPTIQVYIEDTDLKAGAEFEVTVNLLNIPEPGLIGALVKLSWDEDVMEIVTYYDEDEEETFPRIEVGSKYNASSNKYISYGPLGTCNVQYNRATAKENQTRYEEFFFTATFKIKDDAAPGNYTITMAAENYNPKNFVRYGNLATDFVIEGATITIGSSAPACEHTSTTAVPNGDGATHKLVCTNEACGETVTASEPCSGGEVTCTAKAVCTECGQSYGDEPAGHSFTTKDSGTQATPADCTNAATYYVQCDNCDEVHATLTVAVGEAKGHGHTLGFRCDNNGNNTHTKYCNVCHTAIKGEENVACSGITCTCGYVSIGAWVENVTGITVNNGNVYVNPNEDLVLNATNTVGTGVYISYSTYSYSINSFNGTLTIPKEYLDPNNNERMNINAFATVKVTINLGGGVPTVGDIDRYLGSYNAKEGTITATVQATAANLTNFSYIKRSGYTLVGVVGTNDGKNYTLTHNGTAVQLGSFTGDYAITFVWQCTHEAEHHTLTTTYSDKAGDTHTKTITCNCGATVSTETVSHNYTTGDADHTCACGKAETFEVSLSAGSQSCEWIGDRFATYGTDYTATFDPAKYMELEPLTVWINGRVYQGFTFVNNVLTIPGEAITGKIEIKARAVNISGKIIFQGNGGAWVSGGESIIYQTSLGVNINLAYQADTNNLSFAGYTLIGWNTEADGNGTKYDLDDVVKLEQKVFTLYAQWEKCEHENKTYINKGDNHMWTCVCGTSGTEGHTYKADHTCECGEVEKFTLTIYGLNDTVIYTGKIYYGAKVWEVVTLTDIQNYYGSLNCTGIYAKASPVANYMLITDLTMPAKDMEWQGYWTGWMNDGTGTQYINDNSVIKDGWYAVSSAWYYLDPTTGYRAEGLTRVPYPAAPINGVEYKCPEAGAGEKFVDYSSAWFVFGEDGKFQSGLTGIQNGRYVVNGMIPWHYGLATDGTNYYYFIGDEDNGGNKLATGDVYMIRANGLTINGKAFVAKGGYTFGDDGKLCLYNGIVQVDDALRYYVDGCYTAKTGLIEVEDGKYIYVRSSTAQLVVNRTYYVAGEGIVAGEYAFDENGYMINPVSSAMNGIYFEDGAYYYYVDGEKNYAGLIQYTGKASDGTVYENVWIYVRSNGQLATGKYWITKTNGSMEAKPYMFNDKGIMDSKNGIVAENGSLYYYVDGVLAGGAGLIKIEDNYYYVRTSGEVVNNRSYWITNTNDLGVLAKTYEFDANGVMQDVETKDTTLNGVVDGYYYVDGQIQYGAGPIVWEGNTYYVRSNGQVATGKYWTTASTDFLPSGIYMFDEDGKLIEK